MDYEDDREIILRRCIYGYCWQEYGNREFYNIEKNFNIDEYEDVTLSGPFVNPEDLMNNL